MATIHSLPTELLYRILELASPWPSSRNERPSESYTVLQSASLVSTSWRVAAQDRLWRRVYLSHVKVGKAFVWGSRNASHTTSELTIGIGPSMAPHLCQVVEACSGLKRVIFFNTSACWAVLCLPQMAGVTSLTVDVFADQNPPPTTFPFHLTHLSLLDVPDQPILSTILQPTITSLNFHPTYVRQTHIPTLTSIGHQIKVLRIGFDIESGLSKFRPFLHACVALVHLTVHTTDNYLTVMAWIPIPIRTLAIAQRQPTKASLTQLHERLRSSTAGDSLSALWRLRFNAGEPFITRVQAGNDLLLECEVRGIVVEFGAWWD